MTGGVPLPQPLRVLMVCTGNICRSPTAEAVLHQQVAALGLAAQLQVASAGTTGYHVGEPPDARSMAHAGRRGLRMDHLRARQVVAADFDRFDWLLAMDEGHLRWLEQQAPPASHARIARLLDFAPAPRGQRQRDVPDPYYGGAEGFEQVLDLVEAACAGFLAQWQAGSLPPASRG